MDMLVSRRVAPFWAARSHTLPILIRPGGPGPLRCIRSGEEVKTLREKELETGKDKKKVMPQVGCSRFQ